MNPRWLVFHLLVSHATERGAAAAYTRHAWAGAVPMTAPGHAVPAEAG